MSITIVVGGQFGGEGKGKTAAYLCRKYDYDIAVRCGGPNSGHTVTIDGAQTVLRQIPAGVVNHKTKLFIAAGGLIDIDILFKEINFFHLSPDRLRIDSNAVIISRAYAQEEEKAGLATDIGSTCTGTGAAVAKRALRIKGLKLAKDIPELRPYLANISQEVYSADRKGYKVLIEGTQGFGLSVYHSPYYPFATSRDTTAAGFLSEVGASPLRVSQVVMVLRTFPIRVGGNSGPLANEIDWETIQNESGYPYEICEFTSVTKRLRRVGRFDIEIVRRAKMVNMPTHIALMGLDYLEYRNKGIRRYEDLSQRGRDFISSLESSLGIRVGLVGTGPMDDEIIELKEQSDGKEGRELEFTMGRERSSARNPRSASF